MIRSNLNVAEDSMKTCSTRLNESLDILPISDGQNEIENVGTLMAECKASREKLNKTVSATATAAAGDDNISKLFNRLETALEKPKDTLLDNIKSLKVRTGRKWLLISGDFNPPCKTTDDCSLYHLPHAIGE